ncbi:Follicle-stimulating hormone receptor [Clarias magur]|uniref:Follicle-stimulating hormone receptor n=1 Tax=Clarias magur TaxID=1594786 RepID=A0A8J4UQ25_CLAMG|nr:Follicle-stimulating hormone receptor [Clarias magur]
MTCKCEHGCQMVKVFRTLIYSAEIVPKHCKAITDWRWRLVIMSMMNVSLLRKRGCLYSMRDELIKGPF